MQRSDGEANFYSHVYVTRGRLRSGSAMLSKIDDIDVAAFLRLFLMDSLQEFVMECHELTLCN